VACLSATLTLQTWLVISLPFLSPLLLLNLHLPWGEILNCKSAVSPYLLEMLICLHDWTCPKDINGMELHHISLIIPS
jgi:hypothetical protein